MDKLSCEVIADLMPLVRDQVASEESERLVTEHLRECADCRREFEEMDMKETTVNEKKIISSMKKSIFRAGMLLLLLGGMIGIALSNTSGMFYNFVIMPTLGALGYFLLRQKSGYLLGAVAGVSYLWMMFYSLFNDGEISIYTFSGPLYITLIYTLLCAIGVLIGFLLSYIFQKEAVEK